jgi:hypothetical protein
MGYRLLADGVLVVHAAFVLFAVLGGVLLLRWRGAPWLHLPAAAWAVLVTAAGWTCPLTPVENRFRQLGGLAGYEGGFIEHYITSILYPNGLTRPLQVGLGMTALVLNAVVYAYCLRRRSQA